MTTPPPPSPRHLRCPRDPPTVVSLTWHGPPRREVLHGLGAGRETVGHGARAQQTVGHWGGDGGTKKKGGERLVKEGTPSPP